MNHRTYKSDGHFQLYEAKVMIITQDIYEISYLHYFL